MPLFRRNEKNAPASAAGASPDKVRPLPARRVFCATCNSEQTFTRCWTRPAMLRACTCCKTAFPDPAALYKRRLPACPQCGEYLEHPNFEYGLCDGCGSKFEIMPGAKPGLLPNREQRQEMDKHGKARSSQ